MTIEDFELDLATADRIVALVDPDLRAEAVAKLTGGILSSVFEVRTTDGRSVVVKVYPESPRWKMDKERSVYERLRQHNVAVPISEILAADDSQALLAQNVLVMSKLDGVHVLSILDQLNEQDLVQINRQIGAILRSLHQVSFDEFGDVGADGVVEPQATNLDYMRVQFAKKLREFGELGGEDELRRDIERHVAEREELFAACPRAVFCHNDCHYGNVLVVPDRDRWRISGLLDFENVLAADPLLDLAKAHCDSERRSEATLQALAAGHGELREGWREALDLYVLYHWVELWDWLATVGQGDQRAALADIAQEMRRACDSSLR